MKTKDLVTITAVALGTATLTVLTFWSAPLEAGNEAEQMTAEIAKPKLVAKGVEVTLAAAESRAFKAGDEPVFDLTAVNPTCEPVSVAIRLAMTGTSPASLMSRLPVMPTMLWQDCHTLALKPNETKTIAVPTKTKLPAGTMFSVTLREDSPAMANAAQVQVQPVPGTPITVTEALPAQIVLLNGQRGGLQAAFAQGGIVALSFSTVPPKAEPLVAATR